jgi:hypothetical protein
MRYVTMVEPITLVTALFQVTAAAADIVLFTPLLESVRRWRRAAITALGLWSLAVVVEGFAPNSARAEQAVLVLGSAAIVVLLAFVILVVRNPGAVSTEEPYGLMTAAVQAVVAIFVWAITVVINAVAVMIVEPDRAFHQFGSGVGGVIWQSVDTIPVLNIPGTVGWEIPLSTTEGYVGWHMLLARAAFVLSVLAIGKAIYEQQVLAKDRQAVPELKLETPTGSIEVLFQGRRMPRTTLRNIFSNPQHSLRRSYRLLAAHRTQPTAAVRPRWSEPSP